MYRVPFTAAESVFPASSGEVIQHRSLPDRKKSIQVGGY